MQGRLGAHLSQSEYIEPFRANLRSASIKRCCQVTYRKLILFGKVNLGSASINHWYQKHRMLNKLKGRSILCFWKFSGSKNFPSVSHYSVNTWALYSDSCEGLRGLIYCSIPDAIRAETAFVRHLLAAPITTVRPFASVALMFAPQPINVYKYGTSNIKDKHAWFLSVSSTIIQLIPRSKFIKITSDSTIPLHQIGVHCERKQ